MTERDTGFRQLVRGAVWITGATALGQLIGVLVSPVVSRLYSQQEFGTLGAFATLVSTLAPVVCLRFEAAISVPKDDESGERLLALSTLSSVAVAFLTLLFVVVGGPWLVELFHDPALGRYLWLLPISLLGVGLYQSLNYWAVRKRLFPLIARTRLVQEASQAGVQLGLGWSSLGALGLIAGDVAGRVLGAGSLALLVWRESGTRLFKKLSALRESAREFRDFPRISVPATLLHTATTNFTLLLAPLYGRAEYGLYFFGIRCVWAPIALVAQALAQAYLGEASRWANDDPDRLSSSFRSMTRKLAVLGAVPFLVLTLVGGQLTATLFGEPWREAGVLVQIQAVSWWVMFVVGPVINTLNILGKQAWQFWADLGGVVLMAVGFWLCWRYGLSARVAVGAYSAAIVVMYVWLYFACRAAVAQAKSS